MISSFTKHLTAAILTAIVSGVPVSILHAQEVASSVTVHLQNGRTLAGFVDAGSDETSLVIRRSSTHVVLRTRVLWTAVTDVVLEGQTFQTAEFRQQLAEVASYGPRSAFAASASSVQVHRTAEEGVPSLSPYPGNSVTISPAAAETVSPASAFRPAVGTKVRSLQFITQPASWDNDAEIDGLLVQIRPVDEFGRLVPVNGTLDLKLMGVSRTLGGQAQQGRSTLEFPVLETWNQIVRPTDFTSEGAVYRMTFRHYRPDRDVSVDVTGLTNARLTVPGSGTFSATENLTVLRPYSQVRDLHQMFRGTRILPREFRD